MEDTGNLFDLACASTILIMAMLGFLRGFISKFLSLFRLISTILLTYLLSPFIVKIINFGEYNLITDLIVQTVLFLILWIITSIIVSRIKKTTKDKIPHSIDQSLGFALGFTEAYLLITIIFSIITTVYSHELFFPSGQVEQAKSRSGPKWLQQSKSYGLLEMGADLIQPITNKAMKSIKNIGNLGGDGKGPLDGIDGVKLKKIQKHYENIGKFADEYEKLNSNNFKIEIEENEKNKGYEKKEIDKKDRLLDIIN